MLQNQHNTPQDFSLAKEAGSKIYLPRVGQTLLHGIRTLWHFRLSPGPSGAVGEDRTRCCSIRSPAVCLWPRAALTLTQFQEKLTLAGFLSSNLHSQIEGLPTIKMIKSACVPERERDIDLDWVIQPNVVTVQRLRNPGLGYKLTWYFPHKKKAQCINAEWMNYN